MKPAWAIEEYASIRLTSVCSTATQAPTTTLAAASAATAGRQSEACVPRVTTSTRSIAANAAVFTPAAIQATTGLGAPW